MPVKKKAYFIASVPLLAALLCLGHIAWAAPSAKQVSKEANLAVGTRAATQKAVDAWVPQRERLADQIETVQKELAIATRQRKKAEAYLADQLAKVAELERRLDEMKRIRQELEPLLDQSYERLEQFIQEDLPFLPAERRARLEALKSTLNDYDASLSAKARRLLEALVIETRYGGTVQVYEAELPLDGGQRRVRILRLGRLGLFALDQQGKKAWRYDRAAKKFVALHQGIRELNKAAQIAQRRRVISLVELPLGKIPGLEAAK